MISTILSVCFVFFALLSVLPGIIKARKRHWSEALVRIVLTVIAAILTFVLTSAFAPKISSALLEPIKTALQGTTVEELLAEVASAEDALSIILSIIITPIFFIITFAIVKLIFLAFARLITKLCLLIAGAIAKKDYITEIYGEKKNHFSVSSAALGAVCGLLAYIVFLIPIVETVGTLSTVGKTITEDGAVYEISDALSNNAATSVIHPIGAPIWKNFTYYTINGEEVSIENEAHFIAVFVEALGELSSRDPDTIHHSAEIFRNMSSLCPETSLVPCLCSDFINAASDHWLNGEAFIGIEKPSLSTNKDDKSDDDIISTLIGCLDNSTPETMKEDLVTLSNIMAIIAENAAIDETGAIDMAHIFDDKVIISKFSVELLNNPRLSPVMSTLVKNRLEETNKQLELPEIESEEYTQIVDNIVTTYQDKVGDMINEESLDNLSTAVGEVLADNGVVLEEHEQVAIASTLISEFGDGKELTSEKVSDFIEQYRKQQKQTSDQPSDTLPEGSDQLPEQLPENLDDILNELPEGFLDQLQ